MVVKNLVRQKMKSKVFLTVAVFLMVLTQSMRAQRFFLDSFISTNTIQSAQPGTSVASPGMGMSCGFKKSFYEIGTTLRLDDYQFSNSSYRTNSIELFSGASHPIGPLELGVQLGAVYRLTSVQYTSFPGSQITGSALYPLDGFICPVLRFFPLRKNSIFCLYTSFKFGLLSLDPDDRAFEQSYRANSWLLGFRAPLLSKAQSN